MLHHLHTLPNIKSMQPYHFIIYFKPGRPHLRSVSSPPPCNDDDPPEAAASTRSATVGSPSSHGAGGPTRQGRTTARFRAQTRGEPRSDPAADKATDRAFSARAWRDIPSVLEVTQTKTLVEERSEVLHSLHLELLNHNWRSQRGRQVPSGGEYPKWFLTMKHKGNFRPSHLRRWLRCRPVVDVAVGDT